MAKKTEKKRKDLRLLAGMLGLLVLFNLSVLPFIFQGSQVDGKEPLSAQEDSSERNVQQNRLGVNSDDSAPSGVQNLAATVSNDDGKRSSGRSSGSSSSSSSSSSSNDNSNDNGSGEEIDNSENNQGDNSNDEEEIDNSDDDKIPGFIPPPPNDTGEPAEEFDGGTFNVGIGGLG